MQIIEVTYFDWEIENYQTLDVTQLTETSRLIGRDFTRITHRRRVQ